MHSQGSSQNNVMVPEDVWEGIEIWLETTGIPGWLLKFTTPRSIRDLREALGTRNYRYIDRVLSKLLETGFIDEIVYGRRWIYLTERGCALLRLLQIPGEMICGENARKYIREREKEGV